MPNSQAGGLDREFEALYSRLRTRALQFLGREYCAHSMGPTLLLHEAYLVLARSRGVEVQNARHMMRIAARVMRNLLIDRARARKALINGGALLQVELDDNVIEGGLIRTEEDADRVLAVAEAMKRLADASPMLARMVELRFFCGFTEKEVGAISGMSERTVKRHWKIAKARLQEAMEGAC